MNDLLSYFNYLINLITDHPIYSLLTIICLIYPLYRFFLFFLPKKILSVFYYKKRLIKNIKIDLVPNKIVFDARGETTLLKTIIKIKNKNFRLIKLLRSEIKPEFRGINLKLPEQINDKEISIKRNCEHTIEYEKYLYGNEFRFMKGSNGIIYNSLKRNLSELKVDLQGNISFLTYFGVIDVPINIQEPKIIKWR